MDEITFVKPCVKCGAAERDTQGNCRVCARANAKKWYAENNKRAKANQAAWFQNNKEKQKKYNKQWILDNSEKYKETREEYHKRDYVIAYKKKWIDENRALARASADNWKRENPMKLRVYGQNNRCKELGIEGWLDSGIVEKLYELQQGKCTGCTDDLGQGEEFHIDHVIALSNGGLNTEDNIQLLCATCSRLKWAKDPLDFMQEQGFLL